MSWAQGCDVGGLLVSQWRICSTKWHKFWKCKLDPMALLDLLWTKLQLENSRDRWPNRRLVSTFVFLLKTGPALLAPQQKNDSNYLLRENCVTVQNSIGRGIEPKVVPNSSVRKIVEKFWVTWETFNFLISWWNFKQLPFWHSKIGRIFLVFKIKKGSRRQLQPSKIVQKILVSIFLTSNQNFSLTSITTV